MTDKQDDQAPSKAKQKRKSRASGSMGTPTIHPTSFAEVSRIHRGALSTLKGSMVVTSSMDGEGTTLLSHLMAQRSAEGGRRTLLIDLNMRNTSLSNDLVPDRMAWNLPGRDFKHSFGDLIHAVDGVENLFFLPAPLDSVSVQFLKDIQHAASFFEALEKEFEHVVVDTTPVGALNRYNIDPVILSAAARRSVLVMMGNRTHKDKILRSIKQLREAGANIEGLVVNDRENPSLKSQLFKFADAFKSIAPGFTNWMREKIIKAGNLD
ncbi:MAG: Mrp family chromosome partitioning ATPase [Alphaproteobacteria bacterium]|jgi:Mrp family chromosome partitioning ATPase